MFVDLEEEKPVIKLTRVYPNRRKKIEIIENQLYDKAMESEITTTEMIEILQILADNENQEQLLTIKESGSPTGFLNQLVNTGFFVLLLATVVSLLAYKPCQHSESPFCLQARIIPEFVQNVFKEPPKSKILPPNLP